MPMNTCNMLGRLSKHTLTLRAPIFMSLKSPCINLAACLTRLSCPTTMSRGVSTKPVDMVNPLLNVPVETAPVGSKEVTTPTGERVAIHMDRDLPIQPRKLLDLANLVPRLYWREAMAQMEFNRKTNAIFVKNCIESAVKKAIENGLDKERLVVDQAIVGKGSYLKGLDIKAKGKTGIKKKYFSHLMIIIRELDEKQVQRTRNFGRWKSAQKLLALPWEQRIKRLPKYKPVPGYDPTGATEMEKVYHHPY